MQFRVEEISPVEKKLAVEVEWPMVSAKLDSAYKELARDVVLKGFRKGHVPRAMLEQMFRRRVEQEVARQLIQESFVRAVQQHDLQPVAEPIVDNLQLQRDAPFKYTARVEVRATLDPSGYDGVDLEKPAVHVDPEDIDKALERKRQDLAEFKAVEGREELGPTDVVICEVRGEVADKPYHRDTLFIDLAAPDRDPLPGLGAALLGKPTRAGSEVEVTLDLPAAEGEAKKQALLKVTVKDVREKVVPALTDDFAKDTGEADNLDELRVKVREQLVAAREREVKGELRNRMVKELLRRNPFDVPPSLVERQTDALIERTRYGMALQGVDMRQAPIDQVRLRDSLRGTAVDEVRAMLLIDAIATKEKVEVSDADMEKHLAEMAKGRETSVARLKAELQKEQQYDLIRHQLREEKTLDLLLSRANITPENGSSPSEK